MWVKLQPNAGNLNDVTLLKDVNLSYFGRKPQVLPVKSAMNKPRTLYT